MLDRITQISDGLSKELVELNRNIGKVPTVINVSNTSAGTPIMGGLFYQKSLDGLVVLNIRLSNVTLAATTVTPLFTLTEGYRPRAPINAVCMSWENILQVQIEMSGAVSLYSQNAFSSRTVYGVAVFLLDKFNCIIYIVILNISK